MAIIFSTDKDIRHSSTKQHFKSTLFCFVCVSRNELLLLVKRLITYQTKILYFCLLQIPKVFIAHSARSWLRRKFFAVQIWKYFLWHYFPQKLKLCFAFGITMHIQKYVLTKFNTQIKDIWKRNESICSMNQNVLFLNLSIKWYFISDFLYLSITEKRKCH